MYLIVLFHICNAMLLKESKYLQNRCTYIPRLMRIDEYFIGTALLGDAAGQTPILVLLLLLFCQVKFGPNH